MLSIVDHPLWAELKPFMKIENYRREGGSKNPRFRIEVKTLPKELADKAIKIRIKCCKCLSPINPIRQRASGGRVSSNHFYYACSCPLEKNVGCSRGASAREEYKLVKASLR